MKKSVILLFAVTGIITGAAAQRTTAKTTKAKTVAKAKAAPAKQTMSIPLNILNDDGSTGTFDIRKGDRLVYHVNAGGSEYDFIVTVNAFGSNGIDFNYEMTNFSNTTGHVKINANAKNKARNYVNYFRGGEMNLTDASTVWLSYDNFSEMPAKKTMMSFDGGEQETMYRPENDDRPMMVNIKGKEMKVDGFIISNAADGNGDKKLWIHNHSANPLILKMDLGWTIELKEIK